MTTPPTTPDYDWLYARTRAGRDRGPAPARALLDRLGAPDRGFRSVRVIGTNGKGSTAAMAAPVAELRPLITVKG